MAEPRSYLKAALAAGGCVALGSIASFVPPALAPQDAVEPVTSYVGTPVASLRGTAGAPASSSSLPLAALGAASMAAASRIVRRAEPEKKPESSAVTFTPALQLGAMAPLGYFDPLGFSKVGDEAGFRNLRAAEIKHGRVAMLAALGAVVQHYIKIPGFESVPSGMTAAMSFPSCLGFLYILAVAGFLETKLWTESLEKEPGNFGDPFGVNQYSQEMREKELNNGRFAMICALGIMSAELATGKDAIQQFGWDLRTAPAVVQVQNAPKTVTLTTPSVPNVTMKELPTAAAPAQKVFSAVAASPVLDVSAAPVVQTKVEAAPAKPTELPLARTAAASLASGLRGVADALPSAEQAFEAAVPQTQRAIEWVGDLKEENAAEKVVADVLPFVGKAAGETLKLSLQATSFALGSAGENLPAAASALETATMKMMPMIQDATRSAAGAVRGLADVAASEAGKQSSEMNATVLKATPDLLRGAAGALDNLAAGLPAVNDAATYLGGNVAVPILKAGLTSASQLTSDAANMPMPSMGEADKKFLTTALQDFSSNANAFAQEAAGKLQELTKKP
mmetsp:Transcript_23058/g.41647  ORF Transcript_23058/g.41647 Transcript_23058/m.41647 type:complete len:566 (+) Transcript_23058:55-1752(+)|eukprot:CAMPEP_0197622972 /NCGR_PEP_ID=MMETSP1338-20131121/3070_1 /TAXON_ID=43686 ORGANISM="Pelagodinium beii, Strain RCC1491" /NCGR_SAMPLE_ID=MMETSP1338 /ASSEMBLY_ACC=CAM_ASM_000754 /LENGTH=565 /DNA_ID=CAMNT_0043192783 /DNA_START=49 /DNA_END=1746 /DNA_ORIENTATION=-